MNREIQSLTLALLCTLIGAHRFGYGNFYDKSTRDYLYPGQSVEPSGDYGYRTNGQQNNVRLAPYYYPNTGQPGMAPISSQYYSGLYYHPHHSMLTSDSAMTSSSGSAEMIHSSKDPLLSAASSSSTAQSMSLTPQSDGQVQLTSGIAEQTSGAQSTKQSIIFGRAFTGFDGSFYIPVYYPLHWSYDQYPSASRIQSEYQSSNPALAWSWTTLTPSLPVSMSQTPVRHPFSMSFRQPFGQFYGPTGHRQLMGGEHETSQQMKRSESSPFGLHIPSGQQSEAFSSPVGGSIESSALNYFMPYTSNNIIEQNARPRALLGAIHATNNVIVAPVYKLQEDYLDYSSSTRGGQMTTKSLQSDSDTERFMKGLESSRDNYSREEGFAPVPVQNNGRPLAYGQRLSSPSSSSLPSSSSSSSSSSLSFSDNSSERIESRSGRDLSESTKPPTKPNNIRANETIPFVPNSRTSLVFRLPLATM